MPLSIVSASKEEKIICEGDYRKLEAVQCTLNKTISVVLLQKSFARNNNILKFFIYRFQISETLNPNYNYIFCLPN